MNHFSSLTDADHIVKWQVNFTHVLLLALGAYVVWKTDIVKRREQTEEQGNNVEVVLKDLV